jgi:protein O-mannosyl-transferase
VLEYAKESDCSGRSLNLVAENRLALSARWRSIYALVPSVMAVLVSLNALKNGFAYDDEWMFVRSPFIHNVRNLRFIFSVNAWAGVDPSGITPFPFFRPLIAAYLMVGYKVFGNTAAGYHLASIAVHASVTLFVFLVLKEVTERHWLALLAALLFAVHPVHVESVAWVSGITDPLMAFFLLPAFYLYLRFRKSGRNFYLCLSLICYFLAICSKETAITLPLIIAYWELVERRESSPLKGRLRSVITLWALYALPTVGYLLLRYRVNASLFFTGAPYHSAADALKMVPIAILKYVALLIVPVGYKMHHYTAPPETLLNLAFGGFLLLLAVMAVATIRLKSGTLNFAIVWFFSWLVLPLMALRFLNPVIAVQERYLYLPSIGFCLAVALVIEWLMKQRPSMVGKVTASIICIGLLATWSLASIKQNRIWYDSITLCQNNVNLDPRSPHAHLSLAAEYFFVRRFEDADREAGIALTLDPQSIEAYNTLSYFALNTGKTEQAMVYLEKAISTISDGPKTHRDLASTYLELGSIYVMRKEFVRAEGSFRRAAEMGKTPEAWYRLGKLYSDNGRFDEALPLLLLTSQHVSRQSAPIHYDLGQVYDRLGQKALARAEYETYLELIPKGEKRDEILHRLSQQDFNGP